MNKKNILHIVSKLPEKYNSKFVCFSEVNFPDYNHTYIALTSTECKNQGSTQDEANIVYLSQYKRLDKVKKLISLLLSKQNDLVIFHGLFYTGKILTLIALLFKFTSLAEKSLWMTWGGDIYYFQNRPKTLIGFLNESLRKSVIKKFFFISSLIPDELELIKINYQSKAVHLNAFYPNPTNYENVECTPDEKLEDKLSFLVGNSADPQNNHLNMLAALKHLKGNVKIYCILSYSIVDVDYVERVKVLGNKLFGDDFIALDSFMKPDDYKKFINSIDFACYYHNRQQAMGNIFQFLFMGKVVFIRQDILSCLFLQNYNFVVHNTDNLISITYDELIKLKQRSANNLELSKSIILDNFSEKAATDKWRIMLNRVFALLKKS